jgi:hypothetical protein
MRSSSCSSSPLFDPFEEEDANEDEEERSGDDAG